MMVYFNGQEREKGLRERFGMILIINVSWFQGIFVLGAMYWWIVGSQLLGWGGGGC